VTPTIKDNSPALSPFDFHGFEIPEWRFCQKEEQNAIEADPSA
jgi:hypothetical protein